MLSINTNIAASNAARHSSSTQSNLFGNVASLSSGLRINTAADDAAGLAVRELMRADIATGRQSSRNISDGVSMAQTMEGASSVVSENLVRMKSLAAQASNGTYSPAQKRIMQQEFSQLRDEISRISQSTTFNGNKLLSADGNVEISAGDGEMIDVSTKDMSLASISTADISSDPEAAAKAVEQAISEVSQFRGKVGAQVNRLESAGKVVDIEVENIVASESRISDADMAKETAQMAGNIIIQQSAIAMQAHSQSMAAMSLDLIK